VEPDTDPEYAIDQINSFISKIADLQQIDCENPDSEREITKLKINIRGFLRANFKDDDKKLKDLEKDRSSFATRHFLDPTDPVTRQRNYENDLELIKNHLIVYKAELESINYSRRKTVLPTQPKRITKKKLANSPVVKKQTSKEKSLDSRKIFIVHGHDDELKNEVEQYIKSLKLKPIILHKQANLGKTIIEKVEHYSDVDFAIVLLSRDDLAAKYIEYVENFDDLVREPTVEDMKEALEYSVDRYHMNLKHRARQNVIFEWGFFIGKLGRNKVAALCQEKVELPSDNDGLLYTSIDRQGDWKKKLATEINASGIKIDEKYL